MAYRSLSPLLTFISWCCVAMVIVAVITPYWSSESTRFETGLQTGQNYGVWKSCVSSTMANVSNCQRYDTSCRLSFITAGSSFIQYMSNCNKLKAVQAFSILTAFFNGLGAAALLLAPNSKYPSQLTSLGWTLITSAVAFGAVTTSLYVNIFNAQIDGPSTYLDYSFILFTFAWALQFLLFLFFVADHLDYQGSLERKQSSNAQSPVMLSPLTQSPSSDQS